MRVGRHAAVSHTGRRRLRNEDAHVSDPPLFAVADGMGGAQAGELASRLAAGAIAERRDGVQGEEALMHLVREANARIFERSLADPAAAGMGTTITVALVDEAAGTVALGHVGDSRAYRIRDGRLDQLTTDHSLVAELLRTGRLTPEEADVHPHRSVITRALGTEPDVEVDTSTVELRPGDLFLLCSDGLTTMVPDDEIAAIADAGGEDPDRVADLLVEAANRAGGDDNITVVVFEIADGTPMPDERTAEQAVVVAPGEPPLAVPAPVAAPEARVRRWGAGAGSRWPALVLVLAGLGVALLLLLWSIGR